MESCEQFAAHRISAKQRLHRIFLQLDYYVNYSHFHEGAHSIPAYKKTTEQSELFNKYSSEGPIASRLRYCLFLCRIPLSDIILGEQSFYLCAPAWFVIAIFILQNEIKQPIVPRKETK